VLSQALPPSAEDQGAGLRGNRPHTAFLTTNMLKVPCDTASQEVADLPWSAARLKMQVGASLLFLLSQPVLVL
jgi:hypothetical protein